MNGKRYELIKGNNYCLQYTQQTIIQMIDSCDVSEIKKVDLLYTQSGYHIMKNMKSDTMKPNYSSF